MGGSQTYQQDFDKVFSAYKGKRIAVYGTGQNARLIAEQVSGYEIVGFISRDGTEGLLSGQRIILIEEAVKIADLIIIAATVSSTNIIYSRIKEMVPSDMKILDLYGASLNAKESYKENLYWKKSYEGLCLEIDRHEVISFDVFDTLIMRMVLKPEDIFGMVESRWNMEEEHSMEERHSMEEEHSMEIQKGEFKKWRINAEQKCALRERAPSLAEIYKLLKQEYHLDDRSVWQLEQWEIEQEKKCILPRNVIVEAYHYALSCGKKIYFTSDMYFSSEQIRGLLEQCGVKKGYELLVSCEHHASKRDGSLYEKLKETAGKGKILHIGDHDAIDGAMAEKRGIDSFIVLSAYDLLASSSFVSIFDSLRTKEDEHYLGCFVSRMFNNPFALSEYAGKIHFSSYEDIALTIYPMTMMFLIYIMAHAEKYDCIIFPSRDGFFLYQLYNRIKEDRKELRLPEAKYVYASRMALSRAAINDDESFNVLLDKLFSDRTLNCIEYVRNQFDIQLPEEYDAPMGELMQKWGKEETIKKLNQYYSEAIVKSVRHKRTYLEYLEALGLNNYHSIAMVDVVSYGTQVYCLSQILGQEIDMISLGTTDVPNMYVNDPDRVFSVYGNINKKADGAIYSCSNLSVAHLFLEMLYASTDGQFTGISEKQEPIFQDQTKYNPELVTGVQRELVKIMERAEYAGFHFENISQEFALGMIQLLFRKYSDMDEKLAKQFVFSDPYMGGYKMVNLTDML